MPTTWYHANVSRIENATSRVKRFWLRLPEDTPFDYMAGQFLTMDLPIGEKRLQRWRSYSIAEAPLDPHLLELCIVHMSDGLATTYLFDEVKVGDTLKFKGPEGNFLLPDPLPEELIMVCTGTGVAPFRAMLNALDRLGWPAGKRIHLIYGSRVRQDLLYAEEFLALSARQPLFTYTAALSRIEEQPVEPWIQKGYVHQVYLNAYPQVAEDRKYMLCGWTNMIDEAVAHLVAEQGHKHHQVVYELYG